MLYVVLARRAGPAPVNIFPVVCVFVASLSLAAPLRAADPVTFNRDIAPIVFEHCTACHRSGEIGPFNLQTYRDVRQRMTLVADATRRRLMPPWKPQDAAGQFLDDRSLTNQQIERIQAWVAQG